MIYYNEYRPHQGINGQIPANFNKELQNNSWISVNELLDTYKNDRFVNGW